jgi:phage tail sheath protein FI
MPFQLSPGVAVVEKDFSAIVPAVSTSRGAFAGAFQWGPVMSPTQVTSENELVSIFGKPVDGNFKSFFTAANFLSYTNALLVARADATGARNAVASLSGTVTSVTLGNAGSGYYTTPTITFSAPQLAGGVTATGTLTVSSGVITAVVIVTAGSGYTSAPTATIGNVGSGTGATIGSVTIAASTVTGLTITNAGTGYTSAPTVTISGGAGTGATFTAAITTGGVKINNSTDYINSFANGAGTVGEFAAKYPGALGNSLRVSICDATGFSTWAYKDNFNTAPSTSTYATSVGGSADEVHVIVIDEDGLWTGTPNTVLEKFAYLSKASDAKTSNGSTNYYKNVVNTDSKYVYWMDHPTEGTNWGTTAAAKTFVALTAPIARSLSGGVDDLAASDANVMNAWALFADDATYDISLVPVGAATSTVANYVISNICETRLDCVAFVSPQNISTGEVITGAGSTATTAIKAYRDALPSSSYAVMDSGYKYQYDRYNDVYRFVPLNGDVAGLCARTDNTNDPWFSPGGLNRGQIKNVVKLAINPTKADRDVLYAAGVNPVVTFPGEGTVLFGDKTLLAKPSAFDRINVRRLFIVMEKAIATAAKFQLFEFNDSFTQAQFRNLVEPFLRNVQGRRGITDFKVVCDGTNNTGEVIDSNNFVADIYVKPNRSINYITLNFIAARSSISFTEVGA